MSRRWLHLLGFGTQGVFFEGVKMCHRSSHAYLLKVFPLALVNGKYWMLDWYIGKSV